MSTYSIIALTIIAVYCLFILRKNGKTASDYLLLWVNISLALTVYSEYAVFERNTYGINLFIHFNASFWFISCFFMYAYSLIQGNGRFTFKYWHFVFSLPFLIFSASDLLILNWGNEGYFQQTLLEPGPVYHVFFKLHKVYVIIVCFAIIKEIKTYETQLKNDFSSIESMSLRWLKNFTFLIIVIFGVHLIVFLLYNFNIIQEIESAYLIGGAVTVISLFYLTYHGLQQYAIPVTTQRQGSRPQKEAEEQSVEKSEESADIFEQVKEFFEEKRPYINAELRISSIADELAIPQHKLSRAINEEFGKPFYDFVAVYRIKHLQNRLKNEDNAKYTILSLAYDSGFNSKASMNRIFKEHTGMSPSEFKKTHFTNKTSN